MKDLLCRGLPSPLLNLRVGPRRGKHSLHVGRSAYRCRVAANADSDARRQGAGLDLARRRRLERDWQLSMSERLARVHALSKQMTTIAGAARRK
jgi:hypothetical protein